MVLIEKYNELKSNYQDVKEKKKDKEKSSSGMKFHVSSSSKSSKNVSDLVDPSINYSLGTGLNGLLNNRKSLQSSKGRLSGFQISKMEYKILPEYNYNIDFNTGMKYSDKMHMEEIKEYQDKIKILQKIADTNEEKANRFNLIENENKELKEKITNLEKEKITNARTIVELKDKCETLNDKYQKYKCKYTKNQSLEEEKNNLLKQLDDLKNKHEAEIIKIKNGEKLLRVIKQFI